MPITPAERQKYEAFVKEQVDALACLEVGAQDVLWHYTTGDGLLGIIESGTLYATQVSCLNDSTEIRYASDTLHEEAKKLREKATLAEGEARALEQLKQAFAEGHIPQSLAAVQDPALSWWFVTCFSKEEDDLSQWRAYSGGENGYAIGFLASGLFGRANSLVVRVNYDENRHRDVAAKVASATLRFFTEGLEDGRQGIFVQWATEFFPLWDRLIGQLGPMVKNRAFAAEREYRIIHQLQDDEIPKVHIRQKQALMARHLPLAFPPPSATRCQTLPIVGVMVGPSRHAEVSRVSVHTLMRQKRYDVPVTSSKIPFQMT